jgi:branched-chain amino acid transport system ATP-binding protein
MIEVKNIFVQIKEKQVLEDVSFGLKAGELLCVIGANGAGKTTLLRTISGLVGLQSGEILFQEETIDKYKPFGLSRKGLVHVPQGRQIIPNLSVYDNMVIGAINSGLSKSNIHSRLENQFGYFPILKERLAISAGSLSGGEQQMLAIARGLMMNPVVLMLDEPSLGLAPQVVLKIMETLQILSEEGLAIILVEQVAMLALEFSDKALVLRQGKIVSRGDSKDLLHSPDLISKYLS